jgi:hypothetical protein
MKTADEGTRSHIKEDYPMPSVHLNGTSKDVLLEGYSSISIAIHDLKDTISKCHFHGRDYYVQDDVNSVQMAFNLAYDERAKHLKALAAFEDYIEKHYKHINLQ